MLKLMLFIVFVQAIHIHGATIEDRNATNYNATILPKGRGPCEVFNPCLNGGKCVYNVATGRACKCVSGYTGSRCQFVDFCASSPCGSTGTCISKGYNFTCLCSPGYVGDRCDIVDPCLNTTCTNEATCVAMGSRARCDCPGPFAGPNCDIQCKGRIYCYISGKSCVLNSNGEESCQCDSSVSRNNVSCIMEKDLVNECNTLDNPCNGGRCQDRYKGFKCSCPRGKSGSRCEISTPCSTSPCQNGGTCSIKGSGYICTCPSRYKGRRCQWVNDTRPCSVTCSTTSFTVRCDPRALPSEIRPPYILYTRTSDNADCACRWRQRYYYSTVTCEIPYNGCGTQLKQLSNGSLSYENFLTYNNKPHIVQRHEEWQKDTLITRERGDFKIDLQCTIPTSFTVKQSISSKDFEVFDDFKLDVANTITSSRLSISYFNLVNETELQSVSSFFIGNRLYALAHIDRSYDSNVDLQNMKLRLRNCFATPTFTTDPSKSYQLLKNGCIKEETFRFETNMLSSGEIHLQNSRQQISEFKSLISFLPFKFKSSGSQVYLHCTGDLCENGACNQCSDKNRPAASRPKRDTYNGLLMAKFTANGL